MKRIVIGLVTAVLVVFVITAGILGRRVMNVENTNTQKYILENISSYISEKETPIKEIHVGDVLLDKGYGIEVLPAEKDDGKEIEKVKVTGRPMEESERLLRVKEFNENGVVLAKLYQDSYYEDENTIVKKESEQIFTVIYGDPFTIYSKHIVYDAMEQPSYTLVVYKEGERVIREHTTLKNPDPVKEEVEEGTFYHRCHSCGYLMTDTVKRKFCPDCGTPFEADDIKETPWE